LWSGGLLTGAGLLSALVLAFRRREKDDWAGKHRRSSSRLDRHATLRRDPLVVPRPRQAGDLSTDDIPWLLPELEEAAAGPSPDGARGRRQRPASGPGPTVRGMPEPAAVERLDEALLSLAGSLAAREVAAMPDVIGAWLTGRTVTLILSEPSPNPPVPWTGEEYLWTLAADAPLEDASADQLPPLPMLVTVGSRAGGHLLLDLERLGVLTLGGDPWRASDLLRFVAAELARNTWSDDVEITVAGFDPDQTAQLVALGGDRADSVGSVAEGIAHIRARLRLAYASLESLAPGQDYGDLDEDLLRPQVLLAADPDPEELLALGTLDAEMARAGRCAVAVVATVQGAPPGRWPATITEEGRLTVEFVGVTDEDRDVAAARLPRTTLMSLAQLLTPVP
jgi:hypothetical protein